MSHFAIGNQQKGLSSSSSPWQSMSLSTVESAPQTRTNNAPQKNITNATSDISGASALTTSRCKFAKISQRPDFMTSTADIAGASPQVLIPKRVGGSSSNGDSLSRRPNNRHLSNDDIEGSKPLRNKLRIKRNINPLEPTYHLPTVKERPVTPPKFVRDTLDVSDIRAQEPTMEYRVKLNLSKPARQSHFDYSDVKGTTPADPHGIAQRTRFGRDDEAKSTLTQVKDINTYMTFKSKRVTNPLDPTYPKSIGDGNVGKVEGSSPTPLPRARQDRPNFCLHTEDIERHKRANLHNLHSSFPAESKRRDFREINKVQDIKGASAAQGTNYTTMHKARGQAVNPLQPNYLAARRRAAEG